MQSLDLAMISTVQSADFMDFMAILRFSMGIYFIKSLLDLRSSSTLSGCQFGGESLDCLLHNQCSSGRLRFADGSFRMSFSLFSTLFISPHLS